MDIGEISEIVSWTLRGEGTFDPLRTRSRSKEPEKKATKSLS